MTVDSDRLEHATVVSSTDRVKVWDVPTRVFHWTLLGLVVLSWISADQGLMEVHLWSGRILLVLLLFRIVWGVIGSTTSRFSNFIASPRAVVSYLRGITSEHSSHYSGHNPAGGWMVAALLAILIAQVATGLFANDGLRFYGPLALRISSNLSDEITELHGLLFNLLLLFIYIHVVAILFYLFVKGENLVSPMITGEKLPSQVPGRTALRFVGVTIALIVLALSIAIVGWLTRS